MALVHPQFNPVALQVGPLAIHWYGLTYMVAFGLFVLLAGRRSAYPWFAREGWVRRDVEDMLFYGVLGVVLGGRLWGRFADPSLPWAMIFPESGSNLPRHPSQIYQFLGEGVLLFVILWIYGKKERGRGQVSGLFLMGYGVLRFAAEFFREPDDFLGLLSLGMSMGQWLCVPMVIAGAVMFWWGSKQPRGPAAVTA